MSTGQVQFTATTLEDLVVQLNTAFGRLQQGALLVSGVKFDRSRTTAPTAVPGQGDPNLVVVNLAGVWTVYHFDGTNWVVV